MLNDSKLPEYLKIYPWLAVVRRKRWGFGMYVRAFESHHYRLTFLFGSPILAVAYFMRNGTHCCFTNEWSKQRVVSYAEWQPLRWRTKHFWFGRYSLLTWYLMQPDRLYLYLRHYWSRCSSMFLDSRSMLFNNSLWITTQWSSICLWCYVA